MGQTIAFRGLSYLANPPVPSLVPPHWNERQTTKSDRLSHLVHILLCKAADQPQRRARIVLALILGMLRVVREVLARRVTQQIAHISDTGHSIRCNIFTNRPSARRAKAK